jgi:hypothetical protein
MRNRENEYLRRVARQNDKEWNVLASNIEKISIELDSSSFWKCLYREAGHDSEQNPRTLSDGNLGYCYSLVEVLNPNEVDRIIKAWEHEASLLAIREKSFGLTRSSGKDQKAPPRFCPPTIIKGALGASVYENQASTSWVMTISEVSSSLSKHIDRIAQSLNAATDSPPQNHESLLEFLRSQEDTWLGLVLAKNYPSIVRLYNGKGPAQHFDDPVSRDKDDAFKIADNSSSTTEVLFESPTLAIETIVSYANILISSECGEEGEFRVRHPHVTRRLLIKRSENQKDFITLARNGVFLVPEGNTALSINQSQKSTEERWKRRRPNQDTLFRIGNHEVCKLS